MRNFLLALTMIAFALPAAGLAQGMMSPAMQQIRTDAKTASFNALSTDHRTKVQAVITQFDNGSLSIADAVAQIDAVLTPDEAKAVIDQGKKMREAMRKAYESQNGGGSPAPSGSQHRAGDAGQGQHTPDAGRVLLMMAASMDALRAAMQP